MAAKFTTVYTVVGPLTMIVYPNENGDGFIAHSLPTDTIAEGARPDEALANLRESIEELVEYLNEKDSLQDMFAKCAPKEYWEKMRHSIIVDSRMLVSMTQTQKDLPQGEAILRLKMLQEANRIEEIVTPTSRNPELQLA